MNKKRFKLNTKFVLIFLTSALLVSACNLSPSIATVSIGNQKQIISQSQFNTFLNSYATLLKNEANLMKESQLKSSVNFGTVYNLDSQAQLFCILPNAQATPTFTYSFIQGSGEGTLNSTFLSCSLTQLVESTFLTEELKRLKISLTTSNIMSAENNIEAQFKSVFKTSGIFSELSPYFKTEIAEFGASQQQILISVESTLGRYSPKKLLQTFSTELSSFCLTGFVVKDPTDASQAVNYINSGGSLQSAYSQLSLYNVTTAAVQNFGCGSIINNSQLAGFILQLPTIYKGEALAIPTQSPTGAEQYAVASITSITPIQYSSKLDPNIETATQYIAQRIANQSILGLEHSSSIFINSKYGSWVSSGGSNFAVCPETSKAIPYAINQNALGSGNSGKFVLPTSCG
jgi:hypothetical protein